MLYATTDTVVTGNGIALHELIDTAVTFNDVFTDTVVTSTDSFYVY